MSIVLSVLKASHAHNSGAIPQKTHLLVGFELALKDKCSALLGVEDIDEPVVRDLSAAEDFIIRTLAELYQQLVMNGSYFI